MMKSIFYKKKNILVIENLKTEYNELQQSIVFREKIYSCNSLPTQYQKNKIDKDNFEKKS